jgi:hypothetical protein
MELTHADHFFATARERYRIRMRRLDGQRTNLTEDPVFRQWRFCNVHREHDRTTEWFRINVREPLSSAGAPILKQVEAAVAFRWFNRIETGERILPLFLGNWNSHIAREVLQGVQPVVTGAYIIKGYDGYDKLNGVLKCIDEARPLLAEMVPRWNREAPFTKANPLTLQEVWQDLCTLNYMGKFMAYEVVSDLRWTRLLYNAPDIMTWANTGPGCARGMGWVVAGNNNLFNTTQKHQDVMLPLMQQLLEMSKDPNQWPDHWPKWEMREVEHWCCEYDKYQRVAVNGASMKRRFQCS